MGDAQLTEMVRQILLLAWDPIRIRELPDDIRRSNQDEYDRYVAAVSGMIMDGRDQRALEHYLSAVESLIMGQQPDSGRTVATAQALFNLEQKFASRV